MLTKDKPISRYQPTCNSKSILILGNTPLGSKMKNITAAVLSINHKVPFSLSCENRGSPSICAFTGPIVIPSLIISSGNGGQIIGPCQPPKKSTTNNPANAYSFRYDPSCTSPYIIPENSVNHPATISLSASGRSNGIRSSSASIAIKNTIAPTGKNAIHQ